MTRNSVLRLAAVAALGLILASPARAAGPEAPTLAAVWEWLEGLWSRADLGCGIDPDGKPRCAPVTAQADAGCDIDPDGKPRCAPGM
ncbi:MAG TPA: hypothetical protein VF179_18065 [Thermoanaerobaculia bacterium]|nr:hypothetical protein [Thermoanaerobaculia bacterium]